MMPLLLEVTRTHFGSKKSFNHDSSLLVCIISCKVDNKVFANAGLALAGMW